MFQARFPMTWPHLLWSHLLSLPYTPCCCNAESLYTLHLPSLMPLPLLSPWLISACTFSSCITTYRKSSVILIPSERLGRCPSAPGSHRTLSLSWPLPTFYPQFLPPPLKWEFHEGKVCVLLTFCVPSTLPSLCLSVALNKCLLKGNLIHRAGDLDKNSCFPVQCPFLFTPTAPDARL